MILRPQQLSESEWEDYTLISFGSEDVIARYSLACVDFCFVFLRPENPLLSGEEAGEEARESSPGLEKREGEVDARMDETIFRFSLLPSTRFHHNGRIGDHLSQPHIIDQSVHLCRFPATPCARSSHASYHHNNFLSAASPPSLLSLPPFPYPVTFPTLFICAHKCTPLPRCRSRRPAAAAVNTWPSRIRT
jgi:hypothetical protein